MKSPAQLAESIGRFQRAFWERRTVERPPVGVVNPEVFLPIRYALRSQPQVVRPEHITPDAAQTDYEFAAANRRVTCDDWIPFVAPWRAVPWLEAACGCPVHCAAGSMAAGAFVDELETLANVPIPGDQDWLELMRRETTRLLAAAPDDCFVSPSILRGPSDVLGAMRGQDKFFCDLYDGMEAVAQAAGRVNQLLLEMLDRHFAAVPARHGGFGHIYGYWSPGPTIAIQEDALGQCSPAVFRDVFRQHNARLVEHLGPHVFFHLHSTGMWHWREVLAIEGLAGLQLTVEANGPQLAELVPVLREILETSRLILFVDHGFEQLPAALGQLPSAGLYLLLRDDQVRDDDEFRRFVATHWQCD